MFCPSCSGDGKWSMMEEMGYGDYVCPECQYKEYSESEEDFNERMWDEDR